MNDGIVNEVREAREKYAAEFGYNLEAIFNDLKDKQSLKENKIHYFKSRKPIIDITKQQVS